MSEFLTHVNEANADPFNSKIIPLISLLALPELENLPPALYWQNLPQTGYRTRF